MASYSELNKLSEMIKSQKEALAKQMTVEEVISTIQSPTSLVELEVAMQALQMISSVKTQAPSRDKVVESKGWYEEPLTSYRGDEFQFDTSLLNKIRNGFREK
ncbi:hypothetical protein LMB58_06625 [Limosilactobacillus reuteri]|uniref:hypothetical protein n=1 Tax=Limosilactobacillus reuteri TaxID=1598 RepID=UPI001E42D78D|nr:hypothetical protein [Limosilactobacillus reuteri]MCC4328190.1 hypothetical protein [Limosilactobacillus reuteri]MCC4336457.1 hypothetical protein [Limosilactobacillus reuteri]MCC4338230.1 hypothetical protein [Limosilactobacillus reuteri]